ncbi:MAG: MFS transporter [Burkholderiaceae bacterium]
MTASHYAPVRLLGLALSAMLIPLGSTMIAVALPSIGTEFARAPSELTQWLVNSYLLISIIALGPCGKIGDHWGYRRTLRLGQWVFGLGCLLPVLLPHFHALVASRMLMALGGALMVPTVMAVIKTTAPPAMHQRIFGYFGAMMSLAAALGPSLGGLLVQQFGWVSIFLMNLPPLLLSVVFSIGFFAADGPSKPNAGLRFDWLGSLLLASSLVLLTLGMKGPSALLIPALVALAIFVWWQRHTPQPLIDPKLFAHRAFAAGCAIVALQNLGMYALLFQLPYLLKLLYQWGPGQSGPFMTTFMFSMMAASALGGRLVAERYGARATSVAGSLLSVIGFYWLSSLTPDMSQLHILVALVLGGAGLGLANAPSQAAAMGAVDNRQSGVASGVLSTSRYIGGVAGISILSLLFATPAAAASLAQYQLAIQIFAASFLAAAVISLRLPGPSKDT